VIELSSILKIVAACFGLWAVGYSAGKTSAYIRAIKSVA
jgi:hypothetical protein